MTTSLRFASALLLLGIYGCDGASSATAPTTNELRTPGAASIDRGGIPDDSIKPVSKGSVPDDSIKPVNKGGVPDDSIRPVSKGGVPDDSIKPPPRRGPLARPR